MRKLSFKDVVYVFAVIVIVVCLVLSNIYFKGNSYKKWQDETEAVVGIHIKGEVKNAGYYELSYNSRVKDAIKCAGGETENADLDAINLAEFLRDGQEITVPSVIKETSETAPLEDAKVNINTADVYTLCKIRGVGEKIATAIIEYRTKNGEFKKIEHLKKVEGIGESSFEKMKDSITVR